MLDDSVEKFLLRDGWADAALLLLTVDGVAHSKKTGPEQHGPHGPRGPLHH